MTVSTATKFYAFWITVDGDTYATVGAESVDAACLQASDHITYGAPKPAHHIVIRNEATDRTVSIAVALDAGADDIVPVVRACDI